MNRHPQVKTLFTVEPEPELEPPDRPIHSRAVGALTALVAVGLLGALALHSPLDERAMAGASVDAAPTRTAQPCAPGVWCTPSAEVAARATLGGEYLTHPCLPVDLPDDNPARTYGPAAARWVVPLATT